MNVLNKVFGRMNDGEGGQAVYTATESGLAALSDGKMNGKELAIMDVLSNSNYPQTDRQISKESKVDLDTTRVLIDSLKRRMLISKTN